MHERLRRARLDRGEDIATIARRVGVGPRLLIAIDEGRFGDLPGGLYARTALRLYAKGVALDPEEILAASGEWLPAEEDPVCALARLQGLKPATAAAPMRARTPDAATREEPIPDGCPFPPWRPLAAVAIDGFVIATLLLVAVAGTISMSGAGASSLGRSAAPVFALLGLILGSSYFMCFGGVACATAGERLIGMRVGRRSPRHTSPRRLAARAVRCAGRDVRYLVRLGAWAGTVLPWSDAREESGRTPSIGHAAGQ